MSKTHSVLGASSAHRWLACPGSVRLSEGIPKISSAYADEGTAAHSLAERCLRENKTAYSYLGANIAVRNNVFTVTEDMAAAVQIYLDTVLADYSLAGPQASLCYERKFKLNWLRDGLWGTNDAMVGQPFGLLQVYDYKHGAGVTVDVLDNAQMMYYALGGAHAGTYEEVELVIVQPRADHPAGPVRRCRMSIDSLMTWAKEVLLPGAEATDAPDAPVVAGEHCKFCPAMAICPAQKANAMAVAKTVFADKPVAPPLPTAMSFEDLRKVLDVAKMIESWLGACQEYVKMMLENGLVTPEKAGYKLVAGRKGNRAWIDEDTAAATLEIELGDAAYTKKLLSPAQAEKLAGKKTIEKLTTQPPGKPALAPISDPREALPANPTTVFEEVEL